MATQQAEQAEQEVYLYFSEDKLLEVMRKKHVSPKELMEEMCVDPRTIGKWLTGVAVPQPGHLQRIARFLGVTTDKLMTEGSDA